MVGGVTRTSQPCVLRGLIWRYDRYTTCKKQWVINLRLVTSFMQLRNVIPSEHRILNDLRDLSISKMINPVHHDRLKGRYRHQKDGDSQQRPDWRYWGCSKTLNGRGPHMSVPYCSDNAGANALRRAQMHKTSASNQIFSYAARLSAFPLSCWGDILAWNANDWL